MGGDGDEEGSRLGDVNEEEKSWFSSLLLLPVGSHIYLDDN